MAIENVGKLIYSLRYLRLLSPINGVFQDEVQKRYFYETAVPIDSDHGLDHLRALSNVAGGKIGVLDPDWVTLQRDTLAITTKRLPSEIDAMTPSEFSAELAGLARPEQLEKPVESRKASSRKSDWHKIHPLIEMERDWRTWTPDMRREKCREWNERYGQTDGWRRINAEKLREIINGKLKREHKEAEE